MHRRDALSREPTAGHSIDLPLSALPLRSTAAAPLGAGRESIASGRKTLANKRQFAQSIEALRCGPVPHKQRTVPPQRCAESPQRALEPRRRRARRRAVETAYNRHSAKTVCATRRARRRVTEPCAELARGSLLQRARFRTQPCVRHRFRATAPLRRAEPSRHDDECLYKSRRRPSSAQNRGSKGQAWTWAYRRRRPLCRPQEARPSGPHGHGLRRLGRVERRRVVRRRGRAAAQDHL